MPKKLIADLDGELKWSSDEPSEVIAAIASRSIDFLNTEVLGPFEGKIAPPGIKSSHDHPLDLPQIRQALVSSQLIGTVDVKSRRFLPGPLWDQDKKGTLEKVTDFLSWYFSLIRESNADLWEGGKSAKLCTNTSVAGHTRLIGSIIRHIFEQKNYVI